MGTALFIKFGAGVLLSLLLGFGLSASAEFQEIIPTDETEQGLADGALKKAETSPTAEELEAQLEQDRKDAEKLRTCAKSYDYAMKKRTLEMRAQQAKLKHDKNVAVAKSLYAKNESLAKERIAETQKELDAANAELSKLADGCLGRASPPTESTAAAPASTPAAPKDTAPIKK